MLRTYDLAVGAKGFYFDAFQVDEPTGTRWHAALQLLGEGRSIVYQGVGLSLAEAGIVLAEVPAWVDVASMPASRATAELAKADEMVAELQADYEFALLTAGRHIEVRLVNESYGWSYATRRDGQTFFTELWTRHHDSKR